MKKMLAAALCALLVLGAAGCITIAPKNTALLEAQAVTPAPEPMPQTPAPESEPAPEPEATPEPAETAGDYSVTVYEKYSSAYEGNTLVVVELECLNDTEWPLWSGAVVVKALQDGSELQADIEYADDEIPPFSIRRISCVFTTANENAEVTLRAEMNEGVLLEERIRISELEYRPVAEGVLTGE